jgi:hypothetical protein
VSYSSLGDFIPTSCDGVAGVSRVRHLVLTVDYFTAEGEVVPVRAVKACGSGEVQFHSFLI